MKQFGFCELAVVPVRREPSDKAEMSTQLLFGDIIEVLEQSGSWLFVRIAFDGYEGWVEAKQLLGIGEEEFIRLSSSALQVNRQLFGESVKQNGEQIRLPAGCGFYDMNDKVLKIKGQEYLFEGTAFPFVYDSMKALLNTALNYLSCPYLWGGKTYLGIDCSGLTQVVYKQHGISLLRDAAQQATQGDMINFISDSRPGDLAFFDNSAGSICHVGILTGDHQILHCSGRVRIDQVDHQGIFNREMNKYSHSLRLIKRVVELKSEG